MDKLTLIPIGGLANRIYAITSAIAYCQVHSIPLKIVWFKDWGMGADFHSLFKLSPAIKDVEIKDGKWYDYLILDKPRRKNFWFPILWQMIAFDYRIYEKDIYRYKTPQDIFTDFEKGKFVYLIHLAKFYDASDMLKAVEPNEQIQARIMERIKNFPDYTVGIHIRRTDNIASIQHSPLTFFIENMEKEIKLHPKVAFYVATDSEEDKARLKEQFKERIITSPYKADRSTSEGIIEAITEMYALKSTQKIYGSYRSSYSILAADLSNIPLII